MFWQWLNSNWVKIFGVLVAVNGQITSNIATGQYNGHLDPSTIFWLAQLSSLFGVVLLALGFKNTTKEKVADAKVVVAQAMETAINSSPNQRQGGFALPEFLKALFCMTALLGAVALPIMTQGCVGTRAAYSEARDNLADTAYVVAEHYSAVLKEAADLRQTPGTPQPVIQRLQAADRAVKPFILGDPARDLPGLRQLAEAYTAVRTAKSEADLQAALNNAIRELSNFSKAVKSARGIR